MNYFFMFSTFFNRFFHYFSCIYIISFFLESKVFYLQIFSNIFNTTHAFYKKNSSFRNDSVDSANSVRLTQFRFHGHEIKVYLVAIILLQYAQPTVYLVAIILCQLYLVQLISLIFLIENYRVT